MDIRCSKCGEPWDTYTFHDIAEEQGTTYQKAVADFRRRGCVATGWTKCGPALDPEQQAIAALVYEMAGDDIDGAASDFELAESMGLI